MTHPRDILTKEQLAALREAGWMVVRVDAIRLAQIAAVEEVRVESRGGDRERMAA